MTATRTLFRPRAHGPPTEQRWHTDMGWGAVHARAWRSTNADILARPAVLVHGLGVASRMCRPLAHHLSDTAAVYAPDLPGFGRSDAHPSGDLDIDGHAEALVAWIDQAEVAPAIAVGTSLGAQVLAAAARRHPDRFSHVVLASPVVDAERRTWKSQVLRWQLEQATQSFAMRALTVADFARCGPARVARTFARSLEHPTEDTVAGIPAPTLVCWGGRDPLLRREWVEDLAERAPRGQVAIMPGVVHNMAHDSPLELARVVRHFVDRTDRAPVSRGRATTPTPIPTSASTTNQGVK